MGGRGIGNCCGGRCRSWVSEEITPDLLPAFFPLRKKATLNHIRRVPLFFGPFFIFLNYYLLCTALLFG